MGENFVKSMGEKRLVEKKHGQKANIGEKEGNMGETETWVKMKHG